MKKRKKRKPKLSKSTLAMFPSIHDRYDVAMAKLEKINSSPKLSKAYKDHVGGALKG